MYAEYRRRCLAKRLVISNAAGPDGHTNKPGLGAEDLRLVRELWAGVCRDTNTLTQVGVELFIQIFTVAPPLQDEFKFARNKTLKQLETDKRMAHHCYNFMHVFRKAVDNAEDLNQMKVELYKLGRDHFKWGAKTAHFDVICNLLMEIFKKRFGNGKKWTSKVKYEKAWVRFYDEFKEQLVNGLEDETDKDMKTPMTKDELRLAREMWAAVCPDSKRLTEVGVELFIQIFTVAPPLQNEFKFARNKSLKQLETDARMAHHCHSFMDVFRKAMDNAEDLNVMKEELHELGSKHFKWGAKTAHFDVICNLLTDIFKKRLDNGKKWSIGKEKAWLKFYYQFKVEMVKGLEEATNQVASSPLSSDELRLTREMWAAVCPDPKRLTEVGVELFIQIFTVAPPLQDEFKFARNKTLKQLETDKRMAHHCYNFMDVFRKAIENAEDLSLMKEELFNLGSKHFNWGAKTAHFDVICNLLTDIFKKRMGNGYKWTPEHEKAWVKFYNDFKTELVHGLEEATITISSSALSPEELRLTREMWAAVCPDPKRLTEVGVELFIQIFTVAPPLQDEFKFARNKTLKQLETDPRMAHHCHSFMDVIRKAVDNAEDLPLLKDELHDLGSRHFKWGAKTAHFDVICNLLTDIFKNRLGNSHKWTSEVEKAWVKFYNEFKVEMVNGLEESTDKASAAPLSADELRLARELWTAACVDKEALTQVGIELFIGIFTAAPHLQYEFKFARSKTLEQLKTDARMAHHGYSFMYVLERAMENAEDLSVMEEELYELGTKHFRWGAKTAHFDVISKLMVDIIKKRFDEGEWLPEHEKAWVRFFDKFRAKMGPGLEDAEARKTNLSRKDLALAREVWNEGCGNSQQALTEVGVELFIQIFTVAPSLQDEFKFARNKTLKQLETDARMANHCYHFMDVFRKAVEQAEDLSSMETELYDLGVKHNKWGAKPVHFDVICSLLVNIFRKRFSNGKWTSEHEKAWVKFYNEFKKEMVNGLQHTEKLNQESDDE